MVKGSSCNCIQKCTSQKLKLLDVNIAKIRAEAQLILFYIIYIIYIYKGVGKHLPGAKNFGWQVLRHYCGPLTSFACRLLPSGFHVNVLDCGVKQ